MTSKHFRKSPRHLTPGEWVKIIRSTQEGERIVRLYDMSSSGLAFETLTEEPYLTEEIILIVDSGIGIRNRRGVVRHISPKKNFDGEDVFIVGIEFLT